MISRRNLLKMAPALALPAAGAQRVKIATVITEYRFNSHADVIVGRLLEGYYYNGRHVAPRVQVISMYTDQVPANDMSRPMAAKHNVKIFPTVRETLTMGGDNLAVDGVVFVGEHGNYPLNKEGQKLYPRYRLYKQIMDVFRQSGRSVPVYCDKHFSVDWHEAKWMYDQSHVLGFPLMAGSSLPLTWRRPPLELALGTPVEKAVSVFYGDKEAYGFHALETLQCMVERRKGGETGIAAVQCLEGPDVWKWTEANPWSGRLLESALSRSETRKPGSPQDNVKKPIVFLLDYRSGLRAAVYMLNGLVEDATFAAEIAGRKEPVSTEMWLQPGRPFGHFSMLVHYIEQLMITKKEPYPVERTLLTTGALDALMDSTYQHARKLETPYLAVSYHARKESLFARGPVPPLSDSLR